MATLSAMNTAGMSDTLKKLLAQYNATPAYTPKSAEEIRAQAEGEIGQYYDQLRLSATQAQNRSDLALQQQRDSLARSYEKQRETSAQQYADAYSAADRNMLARGMQRSSYGAQTLANLQEAGIDAQMAIYDQQLSAEADVDAQRAQLAQQLADQLSQYDAGEAADILNRIRELEDLDYTRGRESANMQNSLATQIYQMMYQEQRDAVGDAQWQTEYDEDVRRYEASKKGGSGGGAGSSSTSSAASSYNPASGMMSYDAFMSQLGGSSDIMSGMMDTKKKSGKASSVSSKLASQASTKLDSLKAMMK